MQVMEYRNCTLNKIVCQDSKLQNLFFTTFVKMRFSMKAFFSFYEGWSNHNFDVSESSEVPESNSYKYVDVYCVELLDSVEFEFYFYQTILNKWFQVVLAKKKTGFVLYIESP